jgi:UDP-glucose 4-epimerase
MLWHLRRCPRTINASWYVLLLASAFWSRNNADGTLQITGITGYIGFKTLLDALGRGYHVRGVVRSNRHVTELRAKSSLVDECHTTGQLEFADVSDFLDQRRWLEVLDGITAIIHLASPLAIEVSRKFHPEHLLAYIAKCAALIDFPCSVTTMMLVSSIQQSQW